MNQFWAVSPWISRAALAVAMIDFGSMGYAFLTAPAVLAWNLGIVLFSDTAITSIRVAFGGHSLAVAAIVLYCLISSRRFLVGLATASIVAMATVGARLIGNLVDGQGGQNLSLLQREVATLAVFAAALTLEWYRRAHEARMQTEVALRPPLSDK